MLGGGGVERRRPSLDTDPVNSISCSYGGGERARERTHYLGGEAPTYSVRFIKTQNNLTKETLKKTEEEIVGLVELQPLLHLSRPFS